MKNVAAILGLTFGAVVGTAAATPVLAAGAKLVSVLEARLADRRDHRLRGRPHLRGTRLFGDGGRR